MDEIILRRNVLMNELNNGVFDRLAWVFLYGIAKSENCLAIADQLDRYIRHYSPAFGELAKSEMRMR
jgi:hypothetical protein